MPERFTYTQGKRSTVWWHCPTSVVLSGSLAWRMAVVMSSTWKTYCADRVFCGCWNRIIQQILCFVPDSVHHLVSRCSKVLIVDIARQLKCNGYILQHAVVLEDSGLGRSVLYAPYPFHLHLSLTFHVDRSSPRLHRTVEEEPEAYRNWHGSREQEKPGRRDWLKRKHGHFGATSIWLTAPISKIGQFSWLLHFRHWVVGAWVLFHLRNNGGIFGSSGERFDLVYQYSVHLINRRHENIKNLCFHRHTHG